MPRVSKPPKPARRPPGPPPGPPPGTPPGTRRSGATRTLGQPRDLTDRPRGWKLALRRQRRRIRPILFGAGALTVACCVLWLAHATSHAASLTTLRERLGGIGAVFGLRVRSIVVDGRSATPEPLLDAAIGVAPGDPLLGFSVSAARARIETIASVESATVERRWPGTILVSLTERRASAVWQHDGHFVLIDAAGSALADQDVRRLSPGLPLVVGSDAPAHAQALLDLLAAHKAIRARMVAAVRVGGRRWNLQMDDGGTVLLPEQDTAAALARLDALQQAHRVLERPLRVIDLRLPDRTTLRPWQAAPAQTGASVPLSPDRRPT